MNLIKRYSMFPLRDRRNPWTKSALTAILFASLTAVIAVLLASAEQRAKLKASEAQHYADKTAIAEMANFIEGKRQIVERVGKYEVVYSVQKKLYEAKP